MCERKLLLQVKKGLITAIEDELSLTEGVELIRAVNLALGLDVYDSTVPNVYDSTVPKPKPKPLTLSIEVASPIISFVSIPKELLEEIRIGLMEAIAHEDGLDGGKGMILIRGINLILGRDEKDFTVSEIETAEGVVSCT